MPNAKQDMSTLPNRGTVVPSGSFCFIYFILCLLVVFFDSFVFLIAVKTNGASNINTLQNIHRMDFISQLWNKTSHNVLGMAPHVRLLDSCTQNYGKSKGIKLNRF